MERPYIDKRPSYFSPVSTAVTYDKSLKAIKVKVPDSDEDFLLHPATVRRNDRSAQSVVCVKNELFLYYKIVIALISRKVKKMFVNIDAHMYHYHIGFCL